MRGNEESCRYGYKGFYDRRHKPIVLTRKVVEGIHLAGGTILVHCDSPSPFAPSAFETNLCCMHAK